MTEVIFWLAVACAVLGAVSGNRTAWVLLASLAICLLLEFFEVQFIFVVWMLIDLVVVLAIIHPRMTMADVVVIGLFIPAWAFYLMPQDARYLGTFWVVVAQLALTFPAVPLQRTLSRLRRPREYDDINRMAVCV